MADSTVLREFLVTVGFKADQADKVMASITKVTELVGKLGTALEAAGAAGLALTARVAGKFESLYYASQRLRSSVKDINAFTYAIGQMGGTVEGGMQSLENLSMTLRKSPGMASALGQFGIKPGDSAVEMMHKLGPIFKRMPFYQASQYAEMLGIDDRTLDAMIRGTGGKEAEYQKHLKEIGIDQDKAAEASARWAQRFRELNQIVSFFTDRVALKLEPFINRIMVLFIKLDKATHGWSTALIALTAALLPIMAVFGPWGLLLTLIAAGVLAVALNFDTLSKSFKDLWDKFVGSNQDIKDIVQDFKDLEPALRMVGDYIKDHLFPAVKDLADGAFKALADQLHAINEAIKAAKSLFRGNFGEADQHAKEAGKAEFGAVIKRPLETLQHQYQHIVPQKQRQQLQQQVLPQVGRFVDQTTQSIIDATRNQRAVHGVFKQENLNRIIQFMQGHGIHGDVLKGILGIMAGETGGTFDPNVRGGYHNRAIGLGQWLGSRRESLFKMFGTMAPNLEQQLQFWWKEFSGGAGKSALGARSLDEAMRRYVLGFEAPGPAGAAHDISYGKRWLGQHQVQINQKTDINVYGGGDPNSTAQATAAAQDRVNGNLVRWNKNAAS